MGSSQQFSLRWNNYLSHITGAFDTLRSDEDLVDVTLSCEGKRIRAHKMLLSACSTYFRDLFKENPCQHPVIIFRNVKFEDLVALIDFMYQGEVNVVQEQLASFLTTAEMLAVQGLSEGTGRDSNSESRELELPESPILPPEPEVQMNNSGQSHKQQISGASNSNIASPVSFYAADQRSESPPSAKRRKWSSSSAGPKGNTSNGSGKKDSDSDTERRKGSSQSSNSTAEPVEIIPVVPNLKVELPEYMEQDQDASSCSYSDSNPGAISGSAGQNSSRDTLPSLSQNLPGGSSSGEGKREPPEVFSANSRDSSLPASTETLSASDLNQMLVKPGPSGENQSQDSIQEVTVGEEHLFTRGKWKREVGTLSSIQNENVQQSVYKAGTLFKCDVCEKVFTNRGSLYHHVNSHRGLTECQFCGKVFSRVHTLKIHTLKFHLVNVRSAT